jgi:site-specific DNA-cytosine methylase
MGGGLNGQDAYSGRIMAVKTEPVIIDRAAFNQGENAQYKPRIEHGETMDSLVARGPHAVLFENHPNDSRVTGPHDVAPSCVSRYGTGGGNVPLVQEAIPFRDPSPTLTSKMQGQAGWAPYNEDAHLVGAVAVDVYNQTIDGNTAATLTSACGGTNTSGPKAMQSMAVRRLTPRECERLQGFDDDHTMISWRNKPADECPDGPRYKALGNSMAVPCMAWIGKRIDAVEKAK